MPDWVTSASDAVNELPPPIRELVFQGMVAVNVDAARGVQDAGNKAGKSLAEAAKLTTLAAALLGRTWQGESGESAVRNYQQLAENCGNLAKSCTSISGQTGSFATQGQATNLNAIEMGTSLVLTSLLTLGSADTAEIVATKEALDEALEATIRQTAEDGAFESASREAYLNAIKPIKLVWKFAKDTFGPDINPEMGAFRTGVAYAEKPFFALQGGLFNLGNQLWQLHDGEITSINWDNVGDATAGSVAGMVGGELTGRVLGGAVQDGFTQLDRKLETSWLSSLRAPLRVVGMPLTMAVAGGFGGGIAGSIPTLAQEMISNIRDHQRIFSGISVKSLINSGLSGALGGVAGSLIHVGHGIYHAGDVSTPTVDSVLNAWKRDGDASFILGSEGDEPHELVAMRRNGEFAGFQLDSLPDTGAGRYLRDLQARELQRLASPEPGDDPTLHRVLAAALRLRQFDPAVLERYFTECERTGPPDETMPAAHRVRSAVLLALFPPTDIDPAQARSAVGGAFPSSGNPPRTGRATVDAPATPTGGSWSERPPAERFMAQFQAVFAPEGGSLPSEQALAIVDALQRSAAAPGTDGVPALLEGLRNAVGSDDRTLFGVVPEAALESLFIRPGELVKNHRVAKDLAERLTGIADVALNRGPVIDEIMARLAEPDYLTRPTATAAPVPGEAPATCVDHVERLLSEMSGQIPHEIPDDAPRTARLLERLMGARPKMLSRALLRGHPELGGTDEWVLGSLKDGDVAVMLVRPRGAQAWHEYAVVRQGDEYTVVDNEHAGGTYVYDKDDPGKRLPYQGERGVKRAALLLSYDDANPIEKFRPRRDWGADLKEVDSRRLILGSAEAQRRPSAGTAANGVDSASSAGGVGKAGGVERSSGVVTTLSAGGGQLPSRRAAANLDGRSGDGSTPMRTGATAVSGGGFGRGPSDIPNCATGVLANLARRTGGRVQEAALDRYWNSDPRFQRWEVLGSQFEVQSRGRFAEANTENGLTDVVRSVARATKPTEAVVVMRYGDTASGHVVEITRDMDGRLVYIENGVSWNIDFVEASDGNSGGYRLTRAGESSRWLDDEMARRGPLPVSALKVAYYEGDDWENLRPKEREPDDVATHLGDLRLGGRPATDRASGNDPPRRTVRYDHAADADPPEPERATLLMPAAAAQSIPLPEPDPVALQQHRDSVAQMRGSWNELTSDPLWRELDGEYHFDGMPIDRVIAIIRWCRDTDLRQHEFTKAVHPNQVWTDSEVASGLLSYPGSAGDYERRKAEYEEKRDSYRALAAEYATVTTRLELLRPLDEARSALVSRLENGLHDRLIDAQPAARRLPGSERVAAVFDDDPPYFLVACSSRDLAAVLAREAPGLLDAVGRGVEIRCVDVTEDAGVLRATVMVSTPVEQVRASGTPEWQIRRASRALRPLAEQTEAMAESGHLAQLDVYADEEIGAGFRGDPTAMAGTRFSFNDPTGDGFTGTARQLENIPERALQALNVQTSRSDRLTDPAVARRYLAVLEPGEGELRFHVAGFFDHDMQERTERALVTAGFAHETEDDIQFHWDAETSTMTVIARRPADDPDAAAGDGRRPLPAETWSRISATGRVTESRSAFDPLAWRTGDPPPVFPDLQRYADRSWNGPTWDELRAAAEATGAHPDQYLMDHWARWSSDQQLDFIVNNLDAANVACFPPEARDFAGRFAMSRFLAEHPEPADGDDSPTARQYRTYLAVHELLRRAESEFGGRVYLLAHPTEGDPDAYQIAVDDPYLAAEVTRFRGDIRTVESAADYALRLHEVSSESGLRSHALLLESDRGVQRLAEEQRRLAGVRTLRADSYPLEVRGLPASSGYPARDTVVNIVALIPDDHGRDGWVTWNGQTTRLSEWRPDEGSTGTYHAVELLGTAPRSVSEPVVTDLRERRVGARTDSHIGDMVGEYHVVAADDLGIGRVPSARGAFERLAQQLPEVGGRWREGSPLDDAGTALTLVRQWADREYRRATARETPDRGEIAGSVVIGGSNRAVSPELKTTFDQAVSAELAWRERAAKRAAEVYLSEAGIQRVGEGPEYEIGRLPDSNDCVVIFHGDMSGAIAGHRLPDVEDRVGEQGGRVHYYQAFTDEAGNGVIMPRLPDFADPLVPARWTDARAAEFAATTGPKRILLRYTDRPSAVDAATITVNGPDADFEGGLGDLSALRGLGLTRVQVEGLGDPGLLLHPTSSAARELYAVLGDGGRLAFRSDSRAFQDPAALQRAADALQAAGFRGIVFRDNFGVTEITALKPFSYSAASEYELGDFRVETAELPRPPSDLHPELRYVAETPCVRYSAQVLEFLGFKPGAEQLRVDARGEVRLADVAEYFRGDPVVVSGNDIRTEMLGGNIDAAAVAVDYGDGRGHQITVFRDEHGVCWVADNLADNGELTLLEEWAPNPGLKYYAIRFRSEEGPEGRELNAVPARPDDDVAAPQDLLVALANGRTFDGTAVLPDSDRAALPDNRSPAGALGGEDGGGPLDGAGSGRQSGGTGARLDGETREYLPTSKDTLARLADLRTTLEPQRRIGSADRTPHELDAGGRHAGTAGNRVDRARAEVEAAATREIVAGAGGVADPERPWLATVATGDRAAQHLVVATRSTMDERLADARAVLGPDADIRVTRLDITEGRTGEGTPSVRLAITETHHGADPAQDASDDAAVEPPPSKLKAAEEYRRVAHELAAEYRVRSEQLRTISYRKLARMLADGDRTESMLAAMALIHRTQGMVMYPEQVMATLVLLDGGLVQLDPGQGKSVAFLAAAALRVQRSGIVHYFADFDRDGLADREFAAYVSVFDKIGIDVVRMSSDEAFDGPKPGRKLIAVGTFSERMFLSARNIDVPGRDALCDEVDELRRMHQAVISLGIENADPKTTAEVRWAKRFLDENLGKPGGLTEAHFGRRAGQKGGRAVLTAAGLDQVARLLGSAPTAPEIHRLDMAAAAKWEYLENRHFVIFDGRALIIDTDSGTVLFDPKTSTESRWNGGLAQAIEAEHGLDIRGDAETSNTRTDEEVIREHYDWFAGASGTLEGAAADMRARLGLEDYRKVPRRGESQLTRDVEVLPDQSAKLAKMAADIIEKHRTGQPILVVCLHNDEVRELAGLIADHIGDVTVVDALWRLEQGLDLDAAMKGVVAGAGLPGAVTIGTMQMGRGVDIKLDDQARALGGLHIVASGNSPVSADYDRQVDTRAARQDDPGSVKRYVALDDDIYQLSDNPLVQTVRVRYEAARIKHQAARDQRDAAVRDVAEHSSDEARVQLDRAEKDLGQAEKELTSAAKQVSDSARTLQHDAEQRARALGSRRIASAVGSIAGTAAARARAGRPTIGRSATAPRFNRAGAGSAHAERSAAAQRRAERARQRESAGDAAAGRHAARVQGAGEAILDGSSPKAAVPRAPGQSLPDAIAPGHHGSVRAAAAGGANGSVGQPGAGVPAAHDGAADPGSQAHSDNFGNSGGGPVVPILGDFGSDAYHQRREEAVEQAIRNGPAMGYPMPRDPALLAEVRQALRDSYDATYRFTAPVAVRTALAMAMDSVADTDAGATVVYLGRDGYLLGDIASVWNPDWFGENATMVSIPRRMVAAAVWDAKKNKGAKFSNFVLARCGSVPGQPEEVAGAKAKLDATLLAFGVPIDKPGSRVVLVDNGIVGTIQELLTELYPDIEFTGRYQTLRIHPEDRHPAAKKGYAAQIKGVDAVTDLPADRGLTYAQAEVIDAFESTLHGTLAGARVTGPERVAGRPDWVYRYRHDEVEVPPVDGINPHLISPEYRDPAVRVAVMAVNFQAAHDLAEDMKRRYDSTQSPSDSRQDWDGTMGLLDEMVEAATTEMRSWIAGGQTDAGFKKLMDSFVLRNDSAQVVALRTLIDEQHTDAEMANAWWARFASLPTVAAKREFVVGKNVAAARARLGLDPGEFAELLADAGAWLGISSASLVARLDRIERGAAPVTDMDAHLLREATGEWFGRSGADRLRTLRERGHSLERVAELVRWQSYRAGRPSGCTRTRLRKVLSDGRVPAEFAEPLAAVLDLLELREAAPEDFVDPRQPYSVAFDVVPRGRLHNRNTPQMVIADLAPWLPAEALKDARSQITRWVSRQRRVGGGVVVTTGEAGQWVWVGVYGPDRQLRQWFRVAATDTGPVAVRDGNDARSGLGRAGAELLRRGGESGQAAGPEGRSRAARATTDPRGPVTRRIDLGSTRESQDDASPDLVRQQLEQQRRAARDRVEQAWQAAAAALAGRNVPTVDGLLALPLLAWRFRPDSGSSEAYEALTEVVFDYQALLTGIRQRDAAGGKRQRARLAAAARGEYSGGAAPQAAHAVMSVVLAAHDFFSEIRNGRRLGNVDGDHLGHVPEVADTLTVVPAAAVSDVLGGEVVYLGDGEQGYRTIEQMVGGVANDGRAMVLFETGRSTATATPYLVVNRQGVLWRTTGEDSGFTRFARRPGADVGQCHGIAFDRNGYALQPISRDLRASDADEPFQARLRTAQRLDPNPKREVMQGSIYKLTYRNGLVAVMEKMPPIRAASARLGALVAQQVDAASPEVVIGDNGEVFTEFVRGLTASQAYGHQSGGSEGEVAARHLDTRPGLRLGVLDVLIMTPSRHTRKWMVDPSGRVVGIAHKVAFNTGPRARSGSPFAEPFRLAQGVFPRAELERMKPLLMRLQPEFARMAQWLRDAGRTADAAEVDRCHSELIDRLDQLIAHAQLAQWPAEPDIELPARGSSADGLPGDIVLEPGGSPSVSGGAERAGLAAAAERDRGGAAEFAGVALGPDTDPATAAGLVRELVAVAFAGDRSHGVQMAAARRAVAGMLDRVRFPDGIALVQYWFDGGGVHFAVYSVRPGALVRVDFHRGQPATTTGTWSFTPGQSANDLDAARAAMAGLLHAAPGVDPDRVRDAVGVAIRLGEIALRAAGATVTLTVEPDGRMRLRARLSGLDDNAVRRLRRLGVRIDPPAEDNPSVTVAGMDFGAEAPPNEDDDGSGSVAVQRDSPGGGGDASAAEPGEGDDGSGSTAVPTDSPGGPGASAARSNGDAGGTAGRVYSPSLATASLTRSLMPAPYSLVLKAGGPSHGAPGGRAVRGHGSAGDDVPYHGHAGRTDRDGARRAHSGVSGRSSRALGGARASSARRPGGAARRGAAIRSDESDVPPAGTLTAQLPTAVRVGELRADSQTCVRHVAMRMRRLRLVEESVGVVEPTLAALEQQIVGRFVGVRDGAGVQEVTGIGSVDAIFAELAAGGVDTAVVLREGVSVSHAFVVTVGGSKLVVFDERLSGPHSPQEWWARVRGVYPGDGETFAARFSYGVDGRAGRLDAMSAGSVGPRPDPSKPIHGASNGEDADDESPHRDGVPTVAVRIGRQLHALRASAGRSLADVAAAIGLSKSALSQSERGTVTLRLRHLRAVLRELEATPEQAEAVVDLLWERVFEEFLDWRRAHDIDPDSAPAQVGLELFRLRWLTARYQDDVAGAVGVSEMTVVDYEHGAVAQDPVVVRRLVVELGGAAELADGLVGMLWQAVQRDRIAEQRAHGVDSGSVFARVGRALYRLRWEAGRSQDDVAERAQLWQSALSVLERGDTAQDPVVVRRLVVELGGAAELADGLVGMLWQAVQRDRIAEQRAHGVDSGSVFARVGRALYRLRWEAGRSQDDVAERAGISQDVLSRIERGETAPIPSVVRRLARELGGAPGLADRLVDLLWERAEGDRIAMQRARGVDPGSASARIGRELSRLRWERNRTQQSVRRQLQLRQRDVSNYETGVVAPSSAMLGSLVDALRGGPEVLADLRYLLRTGHPMVSAAPHSSRELSAAVRRIGRLAASADHNRDNIERAVRSIVTLLLISADDVGIQAVLSPEGHALGVRAATAVGHVARVRSALSDVIDREAEAGAVQERAGGGVEVWFESGRQVGAVDPASAGMSGVLDLLDRRPVAAQSVRSVSVQAESQLGPIPTAVRADARLPAAPGSESPWPARPATAEPDDAPIGLAEHSLAAEAQRRLTDAKTHVAEVLYGVPLADITDEDMPSVTVWAWETVEMSPEHAAVWVGVDPEALLEPGTPWTLRHGAAVLMHVRRRNALLALEQRRPLTQRESRDLANSVALLGAWANTVRYLATLSPELNAYVLTCGPVALVAIATNVEHPGEVVWHTVESRLTPQSLSACLTHLLADATRALRADPGRDTLWLAWAGLDEEFGDATRHVAQLGRVWSKHAEFAGRPVPQMHRIGHDGVRPAVEGSRRDRVHSPSTTLPESIPEVDESGAEIERQLLDDLDRRRRLLVEASADLPADQVDLLLAEESSLALVVWNVLTDAQKRTYIRWDPDLSLFSGSVDWFWSHEAALLSLVCQTTDLGRELVRDPMNPVTLGRLGKAKDIAATWTSGVAALDGLGDRWRLYLLVQDTREDGFVVFGVSNVEPGARAHPILHVQSGVVDSESLQTGLARALRDAEAAAAGHSVAGGSRVTTHPSGGVVSIVAIGQPEEGSAAAYLDRLRDAWAESGSPDDEEAGAE